MTLYIEAERPGRDATDVTAVPLGLPGSRAGVNTVILPPPAPRKPAT